MTDQGYGQRAAPEVQARIGASFDRQGLMRHLGARIEHVAPGRVHVVLPTRPEVTQQHGYIHAGATSAIADSAGGYAALTLFPEGSEVLTVEYKLNLMAPAAGEHLEAVGTVLRAGRMLAVCRMEVFGVGGLRRPGRPATAGGSRPADADPRRRSSRPVETRARTQAGLLRCRRRTGSRRGGTAAAEATCATSCADTGGRRGLS